MLSNAARALQVLIHLIFITTLEIRYKIIVFILKMKKHERHKKALESQAVLPECSLVQEVVASVREWKWASV